MSLLNFKENKFRIGPLTYANPYNNLKVAAICVGPIVSVNILDCATTSFQLKIKESLHIHWEKPSMLNQQVKCVNLKLKCLVFT